ncbi:MAG: hypothetical protein ABH842_05270 [Candidatus Micrarchaeota archaeon]
MKNKIIIGLFLLLFLILAYVVFQNFSLSKTKSNSIPEDQYLVCTENSTQYCSVGSCSGLSTCHNGIWSSCQWEKVCTPGFKTMCIENGCAYAIKECNECGTSFGQCLPP